MIDLIASFGLRYLTEESLQFKSHRRSPSSCCEGMAASPSWSESLTFSCTCCWTDSDRL